MAVFSCGLMVLCDYLGLSSGQKRHLFTVPVLYNNNNDDNDNNNNNNNKPVAFYLSVCVF